ncbi:MAG: chemotaxis response regulator protein-glutamate methylesterase [Fibrobacter sp.]|jgi:two-component system chemotaxis response regulator CheB|nr:chemotaxis response regulator protein-glutamate methylesterase [Fibrobacter sp.]
MAFRTLIVDDTVIWRKILSECISSFQEFTLIGTAANGEIALKKVSQLKPDLVFSDVHMPGMDGIEFLKRLKSSYPEISVIMVSTDISSSTRATVEALQSGATDFICKPAESDYQQNIKQLQTSIRSVLRLLEIRSYTRKISSPQTSVPAEMPKPPKNKVSAILSDIPRNFQVCVIGVSTGGPDALNKIIPQFPKNFPIPILLVQHMPPLFTRSLAESLDKKSQLTVKEAQENDPVVPGTVYIAPGGKHMVLKMNQSKALIGINDWPAENSCKPSVDVLFRSVAEHWGDLGVLAVILTGMGCDGLNGVRILKEKKCFCITQSEPSCVVYGMPKSVDEANLSDRSVHLESITSEIITLTRNSIFRYPGFDKSIR